MPSQSYVGRFAPSPTGRLHLGTLIAAVASYLQARTRQGQWLVRMEDVDTLRTVKGADKHLLNSLAAFGFEWDGDVVYQTQRTQHYIDALEYLNTHHQVFACTCSRKHLDSVDEYKLTGIYPGTCRKNTLPFDEPHSIRIRTSNKMIRYTDAVLGPQQENCATECGDFVIRRRDGLFAYQLAVVVDDATQGITEVVRGADLLESTARQIYLQQALKYTTPAYMHIPLALGSDDKKLSKLTAARAVDDLQPVPALVDSLQHLGQNPPDLLRQSSLDEFWSWAINNWDISNIPTQDRRV